MIIFAMNCLGADEDLQANELQLNYWTFMRDFPVHSPLPPNAVTAARQALHCYIMGACA